jgi:hypothetical protein
VAKVRVRGQQGLKNKLKLLPKEVEAAAKAAVKDEVHETAEDVRRAAPVLTGALVESVQEETYKRGKRGRVAVTDPAAGSILYGTSDTPAHDFVTGPIAALTERYPDRMRDAIKRVTRKV